MGRQPMVLHPGGAHKGGPHGETPGNSVLGSRRDPGVRKRPPNFGQYPITADHQLVRSNQICGNI